LDNLQSGSVDPAGMQCSDLTKEIIGCAYRVHNAMGFGFLESVYENCLMIELEKAGLAAERQVPIGVAYDGQPVGEFIADVLVEGTIILELKSDRMLAFAHEVQLVNYLIPAKPLAC
jgi:GxxExxY protein